ncbi:hypothetical protein M8C21_014974 [Ambrosia artemisiifolia]|uniref:Lunapark zinc ribbon domain-containing protein n=1 Tax=Ambrosia artemisiifolia TaxID=4212 RepID=A0AAD5CKW0_AMBAR|nr:hypothetical protein M8C21_014974 [Ambrosia artemisiifolia]
MADEKKEVKEVVEENKDKKKGKKKGFLLRVWNALFGLRGDDFEKRLQYISKEEATLVSRMKRRSLRWRTTARNLIIFSVVFELVAVGYAIMTTRTMDMDWRMRSLRVLPMFLLPALSFGLYNGLSSFNKFCDRRDLKALEKLRGERQEKIDELKERTNYYITQQLIQKYDTDPAAKAAAATVLASKLGADSGMKVFLADELQPDAHSTGKSSDVDAQQTSGLRKRNQSNPRSPGSNPGSHVGKETPQFGGNEVTGNSLHEPLVVEHHNPAAPGGQDGGWIARIAALLVGEDPTQSYALICGNCHMHNGLARKEEFPFITYYCPHCHALNKPKNSVLLSDKTSPVMETPEIASEDVKLAAQNNEAIGEKVSAASIPAVAAVEETEANEKIVAA